MRPPAVSPAVAPEPLRLSDFRLSPGRLALAEGQHGQGSAVFLFLTQRRNDPPVTPITGAAVTSLARGRLSLAVSQFYVGLI